MKKMRFGMRIMAFLLSMGMAFGLTAAPRLQNRLQLPEKIYAVPGIECNVYFENIFLTLNPANFAFEVKCKKGRCDEKRWRFTPQAKDVGSYELNLKIFDDKGVVAERTSKLIVVPADAGNGKKISLLLIGSSNIARQHSFPTHLWNLFQEKGNPALEMIGENGPGWPNKIKDIRHEAYGGWSYKTFTTVGRKRIAGRGSNYRENPFWNFKTGQLDFPGYLRKNHGGKTPDFIIISLGGNDTFGLDDTTLEKGLVNIRKDIEFFLTTLRKAVPDSVIALNQMEYCSKSQDAFGKSYGAGASRWQTRKNLFHYRLMLEDIVQKSGDRKLFTIPIYIAIDNENNVVKQKERVNARNHAQVFRETNGLHPMPNGYQQTADYVFAWMKAQLNQPK